jgi:hypothetical protein
MKVYGIPEEVSFSAPDYLNYDRDREAARESAHKERLKEWLIAAGCDGERTGQTLSFAVADGYAQYMLADRGRQSYLVHLPYGDAYQYRDVEFLPRDEIIRRIDQDARMAAFFASR